MKFHTTTGLILLLVSAANLLSCSEPAKSDGSVFVFPDNIVAEGATWEVLDPSLPYSDSPAADAEGNIYYSDILNSRIFKLSIDGQVELFARDTGMTQGLTFGTDGYLYGCRPQDAQIVRYRPDATYEVLTQGQATTRKDILVPAEKLLLSAEYCNDLAVNDVGGVWFTDRENQKIHYVSTDGTVRTVATGFRPNGIQLSLDKQMLVVTDSNELLLHAFRVGDNGDLEELPNYFDPVKVYIKKSLQHSAVRSGTNGIALDSEGRFYVASFLGVQIFAKDGRHLGVIRGTKGYMSNLGFGGEDRKWLFASGTQLSRLKMDAHGP
jgi:gluconolactonase